jgi:hypothetical protein
MPAYYTYKKDVPLSGGATLGFTSGKGYYAKPPAPTGGGGGTTFTMPRSAISSLGGMYTPRDVSGAPLGGAPQPIAAPDLEGVGDYGGAATGGFGGALEPYSGPSADLLQSQSTEDLGTMGSTMTSRIRQALVDLGLTDVSQVNEGARQYIDEPTLAAAKANKYSLFQQVADAAAKATAQSRAELAARGMLGSGQLTKSAQDIIKQGEEKRYAGTRTFSGTVGELLAAYAQRQREWAQKIAEARFQEAQYHAAMRSAQMGAGPDAGFYGIAADDPRRNDPKYAGIAGLTVATPYDFVRSSDIRYDTSTPGWIAEDGGYYNPTAGIRVDDRGLVH